MYKVAILGITKTFLLLLTDIKCPHYNHKVHKHEKINFRSKNDVNKKKTTYKCSNTNCKHVITPQRSKFIEYRCNYTNAVRQFAHEFGLSITVAYEEMAEIIY